MRPQTARAALALREHRHGGVVDADALGRVHAGTNRVAQRHQGGGAGPDPVGQGRHVELDALAGVDLALPVERQMRAVFAEQHVGEQLRAGASARDRMRRGGRLRDRLTGSARHVLAHVLDDLHRAGTRSSVSVTSSPGFLSFPPQHGHAVGDGSTMRSRGRCREADGAPACGVAVGVAGSSETAPLRSHPRSPSVRRAPSARPAAAPADRAGGRARTMARTARAAAWRSSA
jgi:hypothetical protein